jgi:hypothetical protein
MTLPVVHEQLLHDVSREVRHGDDFCPSSVASSVAVAVSPPPPPRR